MSWIIRTHLTFGAGIALFYLYFYFHLRGSLKAIAGESAGTFMKPVIPILVYLNLLPVVTIIGYQANPDAITSAVAGYVRAFDHLLVVPYWVGFAFVGQMLFIMLAMDIGKLALFPIYKKYRLQWRRTKSYAFLVIAGFLIIYVPTKTYFDTNTVRIIETDFYIEGLPAGMDGFRIAHIADIQADPRTQERKLNRYIKKIDRTDPHLVIHSGDLVTSGQRFIEMGARALGSARARYGVYSCVGDHDHWSGSDSIRTALEQYGVIYRDNKNVYVEINGAVAGISLVTDIYSRRISDATLDSLARDLAHADLRIIVPHQVPERLVERARDHGYHLFLGGHTHGGQVAFGVPGLFLLQGSRTETQYVTGFFDLGTMLVSVNNGLGLTLAPIRFQAPAEVSLITLRSGGG
jgi:uncharacterized protein